MEKGKKRKLVSIIVPVYNVYNQLEKCLNSILGQTYENFECILVNDGSTDESGKICNLYEKKDRRFSVIHQSNSGLSTARNNAMNIARGEYVSFIDSDDYILPTYLENMINLLEVNDCDMVKCDYFQGVFKEKCDMPQIELLDGKDFTKMLLIDQLGSQLWQYLFKRNLWSGIQSPVGRYAQDMMILHRVSNRAKKVGISSQKLYFYYIDRSNSTSNAPQKKIKGAFDRAIAFKLRYEFALENNYNNCLDKLMINVLNYYNNAETLKQKQRNSQSDYSNDEKELSIFLRKYKSGRKIKKIGFKYWLLGIFLANFPSVYSKLRGVK